MNYTGIDSNKTGIADKLYWNKTGTRQELDRN